MLTARTRCPECYGPDVVDLAELLFSATAYYYRCRACGCWWVIPKDAADPAKPIVIGNAITSNTSTHSKAS